MKRHLQHNRGKKVSVIVVNFNGMSHIEACISSVLHQTYQNFEVILVDNDSTDGSLDYARGRFPNLVIVANQDNLGYAGGINTGLTRATGEYIAPLNIDTEVDKGWLLSMVEFMDENPEVGAVTPKVLLYQDKDRINATGINIHVTGLSFAKALGTQSQDYSKGPMRVAGISGCSFLIRRELLDRLGLNEWFFMYCDDTELSWVMNLINREMYCIPESIVYHKYRLKMNPDKLFFLERNRQAMLLSSVKPLTFVLCSPVFALTELLVMGYCILKGRAYVRSKLRALSSVCQNMSKIKERRAHIQKLRQISDFQLFKRLQLNYEWGQLFQILDNKARVFHKTKVKDSKITL